MLIEKIYRIECDGCGKTFEQDATNGGRPRSKCYDCGPKPRSTVDDHIYRIREPDDSPYSFVITKDHNLTLVMGDVVQTLDKCDSLAEAIEKAKEIRHNIDCADIRMEK